MIDKDTPQSVNLHLIYSIKVFNPLHAYVMSKTYSIFLTKFLPDKCNVKTCNLLAARQFFKISEFNVSNPMFFFEKNM